MAEYRPEIRKIQDPLVTQGFKDLSLLEPIAGAEKLKAVVIGGGTGAPVSIRVLLNCGLRTDAVVAMTDDGGSTGYLRREADVTAPGDIRKCIAAFAREQESPLTLAFKYRFPYLDYHALGNLLLTSLEDVTGSFSESLAVCERMLDCVGHAYPSTLDHVQLIARTVSGKTRYGQRAASHSNEALDRVWLESSDTVTAFEPAIKAISEADLIVLGPGSLYTSLIPNILVPGISDAIRNSHAHVLYIASIADVQDETRGLDAAGCLQALSDHGLGGAIDSLLINTSFPREEFDYIRFSSDELGAIEQEGIKVHMAHLASVQYPTWHDPLAYREALKHILLTSGLLP